MIELWNKLSGWKSYFLGVGAILTAIGAFISGTIDGKTALEAIWAAIMLMTVRHGVTTDISKATDKKI